MIYLQRHPKAYIHAIYGPTEALLYPGVDKLITSLDLAAPNATFQYLSKRSVMNELGVNEDQFMDIGILVGFDQNPTFPPTQHDQALKATLDMVKYYTVLHGNLGCDVIATHAIPAILRCLRGSGTYHVRSGLYALTRVGLTCRKSATGIETRDPVSALT